MKRWLCKFLFYNQQVLNANFLLVLEFTISVYNYKMVVKFAILSLRLSFNWMLSLQFISVNYFYVAGKLNLVFIKYIWKLIISVMR